MIEIYIFGNSHTRNMLGLVSDAQSPNFIEYENKFRLFDTLHNQGAGATIRGLTNKNTRVRLNEQVISDIELHKPQNIAFVLGEVDIRFHFSINRYGNTIEENINNVIPRYEQFLIENVVPKIPGKIIIWGGVPYSKIFEFEKGFNFVPGFNVYQAYAKLENAIVDMCFKNKWEVIKTQNILTNDVFQLKEKYWHSLTQDNVEPHLNPQTTFYDCTLPALNNIFK